MAADSAVKLAVSASTMGSTATSDAAIAELQRKLGASKQAVMRLEHELSAARSSAAAAKMKAALAASRPVSARAEPPPPPPPVPPPQPPPQPPSPGTERLKIAAEASKRRMVELEAEMRSVKDECAKLRAEVKRLEGELKARPDASSRDRNAAALQRVTFNLERVREELEEERERRRAAERRAEDFQKRGGLGGPMRVPEPPPPKKELTEEDIKARDEATRKKIEALDRGISKLETRKQTHEEKLEQALKEAHKQIESLQKELKAARHVAVQRDMALRGGGSGGGSLSARVLGASSKGPAASARPLKPQQPGQQLRPGSPRDAMISATLGLGMTQSPENDTPQRRSGRGGGGGGPPGTKDEQTVERLGMLDPNAAVELVERKEAIAALRQRLVAAQAQAAAEVTEAAIRGDGMELGLGGAHARVS